MITINVVYSPPEKVGSKSESKTHYPKFLYILCTFILWHLAHPSIFQIVFKLPAHIFAPATGNNSKAPYNNLITK